MFKAARTCDAVSFRANWRDRKYKCPVCVPVRVPARVYVCVYVLVFVAAAAAAAVLPLCALLPPYTVHYFKYTSFLFLSTPFFFIRVNIYMHKCLANQVYKVPPPPLL